MFVDTNLGDKIIALGILMPICGNPVNRTSKSGVALLLKAVR
jgi:hypothetical protein